MHLRVQLNAALLSSGLWLLAIHFVIVSRQKHSAAHQRLVSTRWSVAAECIALRVHNTPWSQLLAQNRDFCLPHLHSTPPLGGFSSEYCHIASRGKNAVYTMHFLLVVVVLAIIVHKSLVVVSAYCHRKMFAKLYCGNCQGTGGAMYKQNAQ